MQYKSLIIIPFFILMSCQSNRKEIKLWDESLIKQQGVYFIPKDSVYCNVSISKGLLYYSILDVEGDTLLVSKREQSSHHIWFMYWDDSRNFWVFNSDIGGFLWKKDSAEIYCQYNLIFNGYLLETAPSIFKDCIPQSFYSMLKEYGASNQTAPLEFGIECP